MTRRALNVAAAAVGVAFGILDLMWWIPSLALAVTGGLVDCVRLAFLIHRARGLRLAGKPEKAAEVLDRCRALLQARHRSLGSR